MSDIKPTIFRARRDKLRRKMSDSLPIIMAGSGLLQRNGDVTYPFRQNSNFMYLTGVNEPDLVLVIDKNEDFLIVPERDEVRSVFDGSMDDEHIKYASGSDRVIAEKDGWQSVKKLISQNRKIATLLPPPSYIERQGLYTNPAQARLCEKLKSNNPRLQFVDIRPFIASMRMIKDEDELKVIQKAIDITIATIKEVREQLADYNYEYEVEASITKGFRSRGAGGHAYEPIVASGKNACTLHYISNNGKLKKGNLLLLDVGAEYDFYAADITRTFAMQEPTKRQIQIYEAVKRVQNYAIDYLKPGISLKEYEKAVEKKMGTELKELSLIKTNNSKSVRKYYPHATSHFLGLDVHDIADYEKSLEPGMVLTVEPGIYVPEEGIGIRIEDNVLIREAQPIVLTARLPQQLA